MFVHAIFIPVTSNSAEVIDLIKRLFAKWFGGFTAIKADGGWVDVLGRLIEEPVVIIGTVVDGHDRSADVISYAKYVKHELEQEAVLFILNGRSEFI